MQDIWATKIIFLINPEVVIFMEEFLTLHLNSVYNAPIQFRGRKCLIPLNFLSEMKTHTCTKSPLSFHVGELSFRSDIKFLFYIFFIQFFFYFFFQFFFLNLEKTGWTTWRPNLGDVSERVNRGNVFSPSESNCKVNIPIRYTTIPRWISGLLSFKSLSVIRRYNRKWLIRREIEYFTISTYRDQSNKQAHLLHNLCSIRSIFYR